MEDKIKSIDNILNSLKRDEEQLIKELDKFNGKYEIENGKLTEPREVTEYKRELEKIRAEIEQKNLQRRKYVLLREKARLADENVVKNLKNMYRNEKNVDQMINEMLEQRKQDIESNLAEIENIIGTIDEPEIESPDIDEVLKTMEERRKENLDTKPAEESEEPVQPEVEENEIENEEPAEPEVEENEIENEEPAEPEVEENEPENESKENEEKLEKTKENIENLDTECENTRKELEKARNEEKENRKKELQEIIDEDLKKLEDILEKDKKMRKSVDGVKEYMLWNEYISDEETKKSEGDFIQEWLLLDKEIKEFKVEGGLDFENEARIYINKLKIEVDANKEESFRLLDKDLKDLLIKREKEINEIERRLVCAVEYSDYIYMLESKDDNYSMLAYQEVYEIKENIEKYKSFKKDSDDKTFDRAESDIHVAAELLDYEAFRRFKAERCNIIEKNKDLSIEEIFEKLKKEFMRIMEFKESSAKQIIASVKNRMEEFREKMESEKNAEQGEEIEEYYETDVHQNGGKFLKGVGKVRKKNI